MKINIGYIDIFLNNYNIKIYKVSHYFQIGINHLGSVYTDGTIVYENGDFGVKYFPSFFSSSENSKRKSSHFILFL